MALFVGLKWMQLIDTFLWTIKIRINRFTREIPLNANRCQTHYDWHLSIQFICSRLANYFYSMEFESVAYDNCKYRRKLISLYRIIFPMDLNKRHVSNAASHSIPRAIHAWTKLLKWMSCPIAIQTMMSINYAKECWKISCISIKRNKFFQNLLRCLINQSLEFLFPLGNIHIACFPFN